MKAWGGRFRGSTDPLMERFSASIHFDRLLYEQDIEGSKAHAEMLEAIGLLTAAEREAIVGGLEEIRGEIAGGSFTFSEAKEDIHMHIESRLVEKIGEAGKKLHTGRSRNDQVSLDMRLYVREKLSAVDVALLALLRAIAGRAAQERMTVMPGYTHLQRAQVVTFGHYLMAYYFMLKRDRERLGASRSLHDALPLGAGALAGSTIPLDRDMVRRRLGFDRVSENSMDTVSDRDFVLDTVFGVTMVMLHLSRLAEDLIIFSTDEFSFVSLPDELCTGSSLMPHKRNPDALELTRGKAARVIGDLMGLVTLLKGLPLTYNRDLQEDKEPLFHALSTTENCLAIMTLCTERMAVNSERMEEVVREGYMTATEVAEYLTARGVAFREAHGIVGTMVRDCEEKGKTFRDLTLSDLKGYSEVFGEDLFARMEPASILRNRRTRGGASAEDLERVIEAERQYLTR